MTQSDPSTLNKQASNKSAANNSTPYKQTFHFIKSPVKLNWKTPRSLYITTAINHIQPDYAPIGHVLVGLEGPEKTILTGMGRKDFKESARIVKTLGLGLGSMI
jgi:hypothetical protein